MKSKFNNSKLRGRVLACLLAASSVFGCDDEDSAAGDRPDASPASATDAASGDTAAQPDATPDAGKPDASEPDAAGKPLYVISTSVLSQDNSTSYLAVVEDLHKGSRVSLDSALELPGGARAYGPPGLGVVYTTSSENGTLTEVAFSETGEPSIGRELSLTGLGITSTTGGNVHHFISPEKAYFVSQDSLEVVIWNPETMTLIGTLPLDIGDKLVDKDGYFYFYPRPIVVDDKLVLIANQSASNDIDGPVNTIVIDTKTDEIVASHMDERCPALLQSALDENGDRYFASSGFSAALHFMAKDAPAPCMLRIRNGETSFDSEWSRSLADALGTPLWTGVTPGADGAMFVQSLAEDSPGVKAATEPFDLTIATPWRWQLLRDGDAEPEAIDADYLEAPPFFPPIEIGDSQFVSLWDETDTTLLDLSSQDVPTKARVVPGFVYNIVRIH
jgi:hypothetical protein